MSDWSPSDTKAELLEVCEDRGIEANMSMLKADIVSMLEDDDAALVGDTATEAPPLPPPPHPVGSENMGVLGYLNQEGGRVPYKDLIKKFGPRAKEKVKQLLAEGKVAQYKKHNTFWFEARK
jgi:hypothetical protein